MVKDRLNELRKLCDLAPFEVNETAIDVLQCDENNDQIIEILLEYEKIRQFIRDIHGNIDKMKDLIRVANQTFNRSSQKSLPDNIESLRLENMSLCQKIFSHMKTLEVDLPQTDDHSLSGRINRLHFYSVREEFLNKWKEHELYLVEYEERLKKAIRLQAQIADTYITEEETETLLANKTTSLFTGNILEQEANERNKLRQLMVRHSELEKIERSLVEVRDMFLRISTLVMEQSPLITLVEYHAHQATLNIDKGANKLEKARDLKIKRLKRKTWLLFWLALFLSFFILILLISPFDSR